MKKWVFKTNPILGHITTFEWAPVIATAALSNLKETLGSGIMSKIDEKEKLFRSLLKHHYISEVRGKRIDVSNYFKKFPLTAKLVKQYLNEGLIYFLLFEPKAVRTPLTINKKKLLKVVKP